MPNSNRPILLQRHCREGHSCGGLLGGWVGGAQGVGAVAHWWQGGEKVQLVVGSVLSVGEVARLLVTELVLHIIHTNIFTQMYTYTHTAAFGLFRPQRTCR